MKPKKQTLADVHESMPAGEPVMVTRKPRKPRGPAEYNLQRIATDAASNDLTWEDVRHEDGDTITFADTADAKKHVRESGVAGEFRVIRIAAQFTASAVVKTIMRLT